MVGGAPPSFPASAGSVPTKEDPAVETRRKKFLSGEKAKAGRAASFLTGSAEGAKGEAPLFRKTLTGE